MDSKTTKFKDKRANLFKIIIEINKISTKLLLFVIPKLSEQLKEEDLDTRYSIVHLFGKMFSMKESTFYYDYSNIFNEFLGRFSDIDPKIRISMVQFSVNMMTNHNESSIKLNGKIY
jgi:hypothetical protein